MPLLHVSVSGTMAFDEGIAAPRAGSAATPAPMAPAPRPKSIASQIFFCMPAHLTPHAKEASAKHLRSGLP
jgi:hypothetical protein